MNDKNSLYNFLDPKLSDFCKLTSDGISEDDHSIENLISKDFRRRNSGFMAFRVSRPPLEILINFQYKIDLKCIKVSNLITLS